ncbi:MAG: YhcB family protein [Gammaproteobacteria bacterium]|nr:YhcB family protein [Gammaproteobacteria bacterium]
MGTTVIIAGLLFIVGLTVGGIAGRWRGQHDNKSQELEKEVDELRTDMKQYRDEVGEHFNKTGELFNTMAQDYREIYQHLATGAQKLSTTTDKTDIFQLNDFNDTLKLKKAPSCAKHGARPVLDTGAGSAKAWEQAEDTTDAPASQAPSDYAKPEPMAQAAQRPKSTE